MVLIFVILPDFRDLLVFVILKCQVLYYKLLSRTFRDKNFHDPHEIMNIFYHGNLKLYVLQLHRKHQSSCVLY